MSDSRYRPRNRHDTGPPRWFTNMLIRRPERQYTRMLIVKLLRTPVADIDTFMWPEGRKPNAAWDWD